jgi:DNA-binding IscR family transcriptional regulator
MANIIRIVDGPIAMLPCVSLYFYERCKNCNEQYCALHDTMILVRDATLNILEHRTLQDLTSAPVIN